VTFGLPGGHLCRADSAAKIITASRMNIDEDSLPPLGASGAARTFSYTSGIAPMMWTFVAIAGVELVIVHFLLTFWSPLAAMLLSAATLVGIVWLVRGILRFARHPVRISGSELVMRVGTLKQVIVPLNNVAGTGDVAGTDKRAMLNLALIAHPNIVVLLHEPIGRRGKIRAIGHRLDDPGAFAKAIDAIGQARD
jgi:hypothetical protein